MILIFCLASFLALYGVTAVTIGQYEDGTCSTLDSNSIYVTNPLHLNIGECMRALSISEYSIRVNQCEGRYFDATPYPEGCGKGAGEEIKGDIVGKCFGENGSYWKVVC